MSSSLGTMKFKVLTDIKGYQAGLMRAEGMAKKSGARIGKIFKMAGIGAGIALGAIGVASIKAFADFDGAMTQSLAIMDDVSDEMRKIMSDTARDVALSTTFSATQAAESYFFLASAGLDAATSVAALPKVAAFAQAGMFDMALATDLLTDAQSALGLVTGDTAQDIENMVRVSDVLVKANTLANATVEQFSTSLTREAGAAMKSFNIDIEEGVAVLAAFADQGVKGEIAGTGLARILRLMTAGAENNKEAYTELGVAVFDSSGNIRNMADIIEDLEVALGDMSDQQRVAALQALGFSARVQGVLLPLLGTSQAIRDYESGLREAGNTTQTVAEKQLKTFNAQVQLLQSAIQDLFIEIGMALTPELQKLVMILREDVIPVIRAELPGAIDTVSKIIEEDLVPVIVELAKNFGAGIEVIIDFIKWLDELGLLMPIVIIAVVALGIAIASSLGPITLSILAIVELILVIGIIKRNWDFLTLTINNFLAKAEQVPVVGKMLTIMFKSVELRIKGTIGMFRNFIKVVTGMVSLVKNLIKGDWSAAWDDAKQIATDALQGLLDWLKTTFLAVPIAIGAEFASLLLTPLIQALKGLNVIVGAFSGLLGKVGINVGDLSGAIRDLEALQNRVASNSGAMFTKLEESASGSVASGFSARTHFQRIVDAMNDTVALVRSEHSVVDSFEDLGSDYGTAVGDGAEEAIELTFGDFGALMLKKMHDIGLIEEFGAVGGALMIALEEAMTEQSTSTIEALATQAGAMVEAINETFEGEDAFRMVNELMVALAVVTGSDGQSGLGALAVMVGEISDKIDEANEVSEEMERTAFTLEQAMEFTARGMDSAAAAIHRYIEGAMTVQQVQSEVFNAMMVKNQEWVESTEQIGEAGVRIMQQLENAIVDGGANSVAALSKSATALIGVMNDTLSPDISASLGAALMAALTTALVTGGNAAIQAVHDIMQAINDTIEIATSDAVHLLDQFTVDMEAIFHDNQLKASIGASGFNLMAALTNALAEGTQTSLDVVTIGTNSIMLAMQDQLSPKLAEKLGERLMEALALALEDGGAEAVDAVNTVLGEINAALVKANLPDIIEEVIVEPVEKATSKVKDALDETVDVFEAFGKTMSELIREMNLQEQVGELGSSIILALEEAMSEKTQSAVDALGDDVIALMRELEKELPREADALGASLMAALNAALDGGGAAAIATLTSLLDQIDALIEAAKEPEPADDEEDAEFDPFNVGGGAGAFVAGSMSLLGDNPYDIGNTHRVTLGLALGNVNYQGWNWDQVVDALNFRAGVVGTGPLMDVFSQRPGGAALLNVIRQLSDPSLQFASGGSFVTSGATAFMAGEGMEDELVEVTPLSQAGGKTMVFDFSNAQFTGSLDQNKKIMQEAVEMALEEQLGMDADRWDVEVRG